MSHVRNHVVVGMSVCMSDILEYNIRTASAIISATLNLARYTSNIGMKVLKQISLRRVSQAAPAAGLSFLYTYICLACLFVAWARMIAAEHFRTISAGMSFLGGLWVWIPGIYVHCRRSLLGYMTDVAFIQVLLS